MARMVVVLPAPFEPIRVTSLPRHVERNAVQDFDFAVGGVQIIDR